MTEFTLFGKVKTLFSDSACSSVVRTLCLQLPIQRVGLNPKYQQNLDTSDNPLIGKIHITVCEFHRLFFMTPIVRPLTVLDEGKTLLHI